MTFPASDFLPGIRPQEGSGTLPNVLTICESRITALGFGAA